MQSAWDVLVLFLIPIGGGIPGGVLLGKSRNIGWQELAAIYFVSDVILACVFEPVMLGVIHAGKRSQFIAKFIEAMRTSTKLTVARYGTKLSPLALIGISFGVDPMTGRAVAAAAGHGFITGWLLAIVGDMFYFALIMASTLWLGSVLGDGTAATVVILVLMMVVPLLIRKGRQLWSPKPSASSTQSLL